MFQKDYDKESDAGMVAGRSDAPRSCWIVTDGKAGDVAQCEGVANALGLNFEHKTVRPRPPFSWIMPYGPIDPRERPDKAGGPLAPPFPDLVIGSGRRAVPYLRHLKAASDEKVFTVCLKDPRTGPSAADFIWVPEHDRLRAGNVLATLTGPHRFSQTLLETQRRETHTEIDALRTPRLAVLVGGNSRHHRFTEKDISSFTTGLAAIADGAGASCLITLSRRTPDALKNRLADFARSGPHLFYDGTGPNPIAAFLAKADAIVVTADSANMIGEVLATGRPVHVFRPAGGHRKMDRFLGTLSSRGLIHPFPGPLKTTTYEPVDATPEIAAHILKRYAAHTHRFVR